MATTSLPVRGATQVQIIRLTKALYDAAPGNTYLTMFEEDVAVNGITDFANWLASTVSTNAATLTSAIVANLHLTGAVADAATAHLNNTFAANPGNFGKVVLDSMNALANMGSDPTFGAAADAVNSSVATAYAYSVNTANTTTDLNTLKEADEPGVSHLTMTTGMDNLFGTSGNDAFTARILNNTNTLQSGDKISGGAGTDTLTADIGTSQAFAITPETTGVEIVQIRAQATPTDAANGNNMLANTVQIDAQRMEGVTHWESNNSRADVVIEDVRVNSNISTIAFVESDPGDVDMAVYFNQRNLVNTTGGSSTINILLMDTVAAGTPATAATPLLNHNFNTFAFYADDTLVTLGGTGTAAGTAIDNATTYAALLSAFQLALQTANVGGVVTDLSSTVTASLSAVQNMTTAAGSSAAAASFLNLNGQVLSLTTNTSMTIAATHSVTGAAGGWTAAGPAPTTGAIAQTMNSGATSSAALVSVDIILDDVGMGSTGGDLIVGGMSTGETSSSKGVEQFNIEVRDNSKLQTINSTNDTLREVYIVNGVTSSTSTAYVTTTANAGNLTVNGRVIAIGGDNQTHAGLDATHHGTYGFTDVRVINGATMTGKLAFNAQVTANVVNKYINLVDTAASPTADIATAETVGLGANFIYTGGTNNDTMVVDIDAAAVASRSTKIPGQSDFTLNVSGGAGNDAITVTVVESTNAGGALNWYNNQNLNNNITISGGDGDDTIRTPGAGDTTIDAGAGADVIYTDNTGRQGIAATAGAVQLADGTTTSNAIWVFNTADQAATAGAWALDINNLRSNVNVTTHNLYKATLTVTFLGTNGLTTASAVTLPANTNYKVSDLEINQAIKSAINNDATLSKLLLASDGPANTLVVQSLIDGVMTTTDLKVNITAPTTLTTDEITALNTAYTSGGATLAQVQTSITTAATALAVTAGGAYVAAMATDSAGTQIVGAASTSTSDNFVTPGTGNDIIVLGTTVDAGGTKGLSSNEVVQFAAGFGNDVIVNYTAAGAGMDYLNLSTPFLGGSAAAINVDGALAATNRRVNIIAEVAGNDTATEIKALFDAVDQTTAGTTQKQVYITYTADNVGKVYSVVDAGADNDTVVTLEGSIDLADVAWTTLNSTANFIAPAVTADGIQTAGAVLAATADGQTLLGTPLADTFTTAGWDTITMTGNAGNDIFTVAANSDGAIITDLATGDSFTVAGGNAGAVDLTANNITAFVATTATTNAAANTEAVLNAAAGGATINMSAVNTGAGYTINGGAGVDILVGSAYADIITTGGGATNSVTGGAGIDVITLGAGIDTVSFSGVALAANGDTVAAFTVGTDIIGLDVDYTTAATAAGVVAVVEDEAVAAANANNAAYDLGTATAGDTNTLDLVTLDGTVLANIANANLAAAADGTELLKALVTAGVGNAATGIQMNNVGDSLYIATVAGGVGYLYIAATGADNLAAAAEITLVGTFAAADISGVVAAQTIMVA